MSIMNQTRGFSMKFNKVTHCIFDMDGTLLDTERLYTEATQKILDPFDKIYTPDVKLKLMGQQHREVCETIVNTYDLPITWEEYSALQRYHSTQLMIDSVLLPGAAELVKHLHSQNIPMCIATSSSEEMMDVKIKNHSELFKLFNHRVCGSTDKEVKQSKPAPDIFLIAAARFPDNPKPENCLVFEDAPNGVTGAIAANMQCVMIPDQIVPKEQCQHATLILNSLHEFKPEEFGLPPM